MHLELYLIEILHQTTTETLNSLPLLSCILLKFYIKPQLTNNQPSANGRCILLKFYIKPQPLCKNSFQFLVVSY